MSLSGLALLLLASPLAPQEEEQSPSLQVEDLRSSIRGMRMSLLVGGDKVREAETEAIDFYSHRIELIDQRMDTVQADLTEKRATYNVTLDRALNADDATARATAMKKAQAMSYEVAALEREAEDLKLKRKNVSKLVRAVEDRGRERTELATRLETSTDIEAEFGLSIGGVGLAPTVEVQPAGSPLTDDRLVQDLLERDPRGARRLLFEADPKGYWTRFPLQPPSDVVRRALTFPLPDLPGKR